MNQTVKFKRLRLILKDFIKDMSDPFYPNMAPGLAYYFLLSIAPIFLSLSYFAGFFFIDSNLLTQIIEKYLPNQMSEILLPFFSQQSATAGLISTVIIFVFTLYLASRGCYALIKVADYADGNLAAPTLREAPRMFIFRHIKAVILTLFMVLIVFLSLIVMVFGKTLLNIAISFIEIDSLAQLLRNVDDIVSYPVIVLAVFITLLFFYSWMPTKRKKLGETVHGALFTTAGIFIASYGFMIYIKYFFNRNSVYGALSSIIILILWFFILAFVLIIGIIVNHAFMKNPPEKKSQKDTIIITKLRRP